MALVTNMRYDAVQPRTHCELLKVIATEAEKLLLDWTPPTTCPNTQNFLYQLLLIELILCQKRVWRMRPASALNLNQDSHEAILYSKSQGRWARQRPRRRVRGHTEGKDLRLHNQKWIDSINKTWLNFYKERERTFLLHPTPSLTTTSMDTWLTLYPLSTLLVLQLTMVKEFWFADYNISL